jgi:hypothetical protein
MKREIFLNAFDMNAIGHLDSAATARFGAAS